MTTKELDSYFRKLLDIEGFAPVDDSLNGIQVDNDGAEVRKVVFAVDACLETITAAAQRGAGMLFVHHGLFWGKPSRISGALRERIRVLLEHNVALYGVHLPLDANLEVGNNRVLADLVGLRDLEPFGLYHGKKIGVKGYLTEPMSVDEVVKKISFMNRGPAAVHSFGKKESRTCAIVSGGAAFESLEAIEEGIDLYITGEASHSVYHYALEGKLNMIAGGHYSTEVWGVRRVMERLAAETELEVEFIDVPTGL
jgi:dinuclear metal center YbgI/SA1388 family protein